MRSVANRALKTFVETFVTALIPTIVMMLSNPMDYNFSNWKIYVIQFVLPAIATGISAAWNGIENAIKSSREKTEE